MRGGLLASGDAFFETLPAFFGAHALWEPNMMLGYPLFADPNQATFYPLGRLCQYLWQGYNAFIIFPYVLAAVALCGLTRRVTKSLAGGIVAGSAFSLGGFMIAHQAHAMIVHPAAWTVVGLWSIDELSHGFKKRWVALGAAAIALCAVSGQPQVLAFGLTTIAAYTLVVSRTLAHGERAKYLRRIGAVGAIGIVLAAVQLLPEAELGSASSRASISLTEYTRLSVPPADFFVRLMFPYALGASDEAGQTAATGGGLTGFVELSNFVCIPALMLAATGMAAFRSDPRIRLWSFVAAAGAALSVGNALGLAALTHEMPVYSLFRIPGRHAYELTLALSILAGYGAASMQHGRVSVRTVRLAIGAVAALVIFGYALFAITQLWPLAETQEAALWASGLFNPLQNPAVAVPLMSLVAGAGILYAWCRRPQSAALAATSVALVALTAAQPAYAAYWSHSYTLALQLREPPVASEVAAYLRERGGRFHWLPGLSGPDGLPPNLSILWGVPTIDGYTPLSVRPVATLIGLSPAETFVSADIRSLDITGTRLVISPAFTSGRTLPQLRTIGHTGGRVVNDAVFPVASSVSRVAVISALRDAREIPDGRIVAVARLTDRRGGVTEFPIRAGRETAEYAYDRAHGRAIRHRRATAFTTNDAGEHSYITYLASRSGEPIRRVALHWTSPIGSMAIVNMLPVTRPTPHDGASDRGAFGALTSFYEDPEHWRPLPLDPKFAIFENASVRPDAWIVHDALTVSDDEAAAIVKTGASNGRAFDPAAVALSADRLAGPFGPRSSRDFAVIASNDATSVAMRVRCLHRCIVVDNAAWYPGWRAAIDGRPAALHRVDLGLRGIEVPPGEHAVSFVFRPVSLIAGAALSCGALAALAVWLSIPTLRAARTEQRQRTENVRGCVGR